jgi:hypothetical protein
VGERQPDASVVSAIEAFARARASGDVDGMTVAALAISAQQQFGTDPGRGPAMLHAAYEATLPGAGRTRLAAALARSWAYGGDPQRAERFAVEAVTAAETLNDGLLLADALDAALVARWGPDDADERVKATTRLEQVAGHLDDPEVHLRARIWMLIAALERLDAVGVRRQLRALDVLAAESQSLRIRFYATSRRAMFALVTGDVAQADELTADARAAGNEAGEPDARGVVHSLITEVARQRDDLHVLSAEAGEFEVYGMREGIPSVVAQAAVVWLVAGDPEHALTLMHQVADAGLTAVARDVDWLLTVTSLVEVAASVGGQALLEEAVEVLSPYRGRVVLNAGAVTFHGVVDDYLSQACAALGRATAAGEWRRAAATAYSRLGATWWLQRLGTQRTNGDGVATVAVLHPARGGGWVVGTARSAVFLPDMKGLHYLHALLERPGVDISSLALSDEAAGHPRQGLGESDAGELLDAVALADYRRRLGEIDADLAEAESWADLERSHAMHREREALLRELRAATGLHGRRRVSVTAAERARVAVRKAIVAAIERITAHDAEVGRHLHDCVHTGSWCRYDPSSARPIAWRLAPP